MVRPGDKSLGSLPFHTIPIRNILTSKDVSTKDVCRIHMHTYSCMSHSHIFLGGQYVISREFNGANDSCANCSLACLERDQCKGKQDWDRHSVTVKRLQPRHTHPRTNTHSPGSLPRKIQLWQQPYYLCGLKIYCALTQTHKYTQQKDHECTYSR